MAKKCCEYHDNLFEAWLDANIEPPTDLTECGMAGMGPAILCCEKCPLRSWYISDPNKPVKYYSQRRPVEYIQDVIKEAADE